MKILIFAIFGLLVAYSRAQEPWTVACTFVIFGNDYDCVINGGFVPDNENVVITIVGDHQNSRTNNDVTRVRVTNSFYSFIIRAFFDYFPNLRSYEYSISVHPLRLQANAFFNTPNLRTIAITSTPLSVVGNHAFQGADNLEILNLSSNNISVVPQWMLAGVPNLVNIDLSGNQITSVSDVALRTLPNLQSLSIANNQVVRVPGNWLLTNVNLLNFNAANNQIDEMGHRFLDPVLILNTLNLSNNRCVNGQWANIGGAGGPTKDVIRQQLQNCFRNYGGPTEQKEFVMELRGIVRLYDEFGNPIITL